MNLEINIRISKSFLKIKNKSNNNEQVGITFFENRSFKPYSLFFLYFKWLKLPFPTECDT